MAFLITKSMLLGVSVSPERLRVRNLFQTLDVPWSSVNRIYSAPAGKARGSGGPIKLWIETRDHRTFAVHAVGAGARRERLLDALQRTARSVGVTNAVDERGLRQNDSILRVLSAGRLRSNDPRESAEAERLLWARMLAGLPLVALVALNVGVLAALGLTVAGLAFALAVRRHRQRPPR
jgi:hypothetical protein